MNEEETALPGKGKIMPVDHRVTQLEACVTGLQKDMSLIRQQNEGVLAKITEMARSYQDLAAFTTVATADQARKDERWRNHERIHDGILDDLKEIGEAVQANTTKIESEMRVLEDKVQSNALTLAKMLGVGGFGGAITGIAVWLLEKL